MRTDRTAQLIYLLGAIERRNGAELTNKFAIVDWLTAQLDAGHSLDQVLLRYEQEQQSRSTIH
ncbi:hypothetical protein [Pseudomonas sp. Marseille-P9899]|jgi:hypothetical protein|uniref:hypothetical protein n=1 Tax=Pseudomonas sp. Marseille-P9899 TaxID=2730401 RepID=UPI0015889CDE|nr:hypothetical protein [Pseudomonas sp. Marseille-P9899]